MLTEQPVRKNTEIRKKKKNLEAILIKSFPALRRELMFIATPVKVHYYPVNFISGIKMHIGMYPLAHFFTGLCGCCPMANMGIMISVIYLRLQMKTSIIRQETKG